MKISVDASTVSELLGELGPADSTKRRKIRAALLKQLKLDPADPDAIWEKIEKLIEYALSSRDAVLKAPHDFLKSRPVLARIAAAVLLASDDEGLLLEKLWRRCSLLTSSKRDTSLLPLALKAFGPYAYEDPSRRRIAGRTVSRDRNAIRYLFWKEKLPTQFVNFWKVPGQGIDACSRLWSRRNEPTAKAASDKPRSVWPLAGSGRSRAVINACAPGERLNAILTIMPNGRLRAEKVQKISRSGI